MASRLPGLVARAGLAVVACVAPLSAHGQAVSSRHVVSREEIRRAGIVRIGELLRLAPWASVRTVDEFTWRGTDGVSPLEDDRWVLVVDGALVEPGLLGVASLSRAPLDLHSVDSVAFDVAAIGGPYARAGAGRVEIYSRLPPRGVTGGGRVVTGSETGDPGPYAFIPPAAPNQDRFGHDAALAAGVRAGRWSAAASVGVGVHIATDQAIFDRLLAAGSGFPRLEYVTPSLRVVFDGAGGEHRLLAGRSEIDDWVRIEAVGLEAPARLVLEHAGATGVVRAGSGRLLRYSVSGERSVAGLRATAVSPTLDVARSGGHASLEAGFGATRVGLAASRRTFTANRLPEDDAYFGVRAFARAEVSLSARARLHAAGSLDAARSRIGPALELGSAWRIGSDQLRGVLAVSQDVGRPHDELWPMVRHGLAWLADAGVPVSGHGDGEGGRAGATLAWTRTLQSRLRFTLDGSAELRRHPSIPLRALDLDASSAAWRGPVTLTAGAVSRAAAVGALVRWRTTRVAVEGGYQVRWVGGDSVVRLASRAAPRHAGRVGVTYVPAASLEITTQLAVRGSSRWTEYGGAAIGDVPGAAIVDVAVGKSLWNGRINTRLGLRNLLDGENRLHPEGADARFSFVLMVDGELGGFSRR